MPLTVLDEMLGSSPGESTRTAVDGDTFTTPENDNPVRWRGADTPERSKVLNGAVFVGEPGAEQATQLGEMGETHFVLGDTWLKRFDQRMAQEGGMLSVGALRR